MGLTNGAQGGYAWLEVEEDLKTFLGLCPQVVLNKRLAITAVDSGSFAPSE